MIYLFYNISAVIYICIDKCGIIRILLSSTFHLILMYCLILLRSYPNIWPFLILISIWNHSSSQRKRENRKYVNPCSILVSPEANISIIFPISSQHFRGAWQCPPKKWDISNTFYERFNISSPMKACISYGQKQKKLLSWFLNEV